MRRFHAEIDSQTTQMRTATVGTFVGTTVLQTKECAYEILSRRHQTKIELNQGCTPRGRRPRTEFGSSDQKLWWLTLGHAKGSSRSSKLLNGRAWRSHPRPLWAAPLAPCPDTLSSCWNPHLLKPAYLRILRLRTGCGPFCLRDVRSGPCLRRRSQ